MGHKIIEAIIENGKLKNIDKKLFKGKLKVHLIIDDDDKEIPTKSEISKIVRESSGLYKTIDVDKESKKLRKSWERNAKI